MISVIIPVYKVEKYLDKCIESVVGQTYSDLEIILVDDGSPDGCPAMCDAWAEKDGRIKVIHKPNGGLSSARNAGLVKASGEYVFFLDSDDTISANCIELLADAVRHDNSDICIANVARIDENGKPTAIELDFVKAVDFFPCAFNNKGEITAAGVGGGAWGGPPAGISRSWTPRGARLAASSAGKAICRWHARRCMKRV